MTQNYFITVSRGILSIEHQKKIGSALWQYLWLLDKMTRIDENGMGLVLGGKPIKLEEIGGIHKVNISKNIKKLKENGYIDIKRTPYGIIIKIFKAKKFFNSKDKKELYYNDLGQISPEEDIKIVSKKVELNQPKGDKHYNWKGGITPKNRVDRTSTEYKIWRSKVFERDKYTCQECLVVGGSLEAHHLIKFSENEKLRFKVSNGQTLCKACHKKISFPKSSISNIIKTGISNIINSEPKTELAKSLNPTTISLNVYRENNIESTVLNIYALYQEKINKNSKLLDKAKDKIKARLKVYSLEDLKKAIDNFSADGWWMKNNAHRGVAWFFHSDERIEQLMNMKPRAVINNNINQPEVAQDKYKNLNL